MSYFIAMSACVLLSTGDTECGNNSLHSVGKIDNYQVCTGFASQKRREIEAALRDEAAKMGKVIKSTMVFVECVTPEMAADFMIDKVGT
ncbi:hypothetical protein [Pseudomonas sp.]|uniref:hypothetical protein n=1 Tax=Pseudomonas sp. TaxID=306 RepID=UPI002FC9274C